MRGKTGSRTGVCVFALLLALVLPASFRSQNDLPDLQPFHPKGWSDAVVVSNRQGDNVDTLGLNATDSLYVDFAVINDGGSPVGEPFRIDLFIDGRLLETFDVSSPLIPQVYRYREDYPIGRLSAGTHTLRIVADAENSVSESDEFDNEYTKTIRVGGDCFPLATRVSPRGAGTLTPSQEPTCGHPTTSVAASAVRGEVPSRELGIAGKPIARALRARALTALRAKAQGEGRVRVIVGLRTEGSATASVVDGLAATRKRSPLIARAQQSLTIRLSGQNVSVIRRFKFIPYMALEVDGAGLEALAIDAEVVSIEEDRVVKPVLGESTSVIGAPNAWRQGFAGTGQTVAILDTGVDKRHPFLKDKVVSEACYSGGGRDVSSLCPGGAKESTAAGSGVPCVLNGCDHGTAVAGIAAGKGEAFSGVAPEATIIAIQLFRQCSSGEDCIISNTSNEIAGLERVLELSAGFDIAAVNLSLSTVDTRSECDSWGAYKAAIDNLRAVGIATVAGAGNAGSSTGIGSPACISSAVSVGATHDGSGREPRDTVANYSNSSPALDLLAPGSTIVTSSPGDSYINFSGTSAATPHVTGAWAVLKSKAPNASVSDLLSVLKDTGIPVTDPRNGLVKPRIQVDAALDRIVQELSYASDTRLTLTARPNPGFRFKSWRGCGSSSGNRCVVEMNSGQDVTAVFEPATASFPDLLTTSLVGPAMATVGSEASVSVAIRNQGSAKAVPFRVGFYLSADSNITTDDTWFAACFFDLGLAAGSLETCSRSFPIPPRISPGRYSLGAIVDDLDQVAENSETNNGRAADSGTIDILPAPLLSTRTFIPVVLTAAGRNNSFFTSELSLTNRGSREAQLDFTYTAHRGGGSGETSDVLSPGQQKIVPDALAYLRRLGIPIPETGNRIGTLAVEALASSEVGVVARTTTRVPKGRAGLAYPGIRNHEGFHEAVYLCGLRQNEQDRSNVALQNMGTTGEGPITLRTTVFSGGLHDSRIKVLEDVTLRPGEFHQYSSVLGIFPNGYVKVEKVDGAAPFYAYGVINDQVNSDGSFVFPVSELSGSGTTGQTLPVIVEIRDFTSELTLTNFSGAARTVDFSFVADGLDTADETARFSLRLEVNQQRIISDFIHTELRQKSVDGVGSLRGGLAGSLFATVEHGDMGGIVIGARTGAKGDDGRYSVFYNAVPGGSAFTDSAWVYGLQQNEENRSNLALINTGEIDEAGSVYVLDIYDGDTGRLVKTVTTKPLPARRWRQINGILANYARGTRHGYVHIQKISGNNPFLAYGVVNDGGAPGERSGDGAYVPASH